MIRRLGYFSPVSISAISAARAARFLAAADGNTPMPSTANINRLLLRLSTLSFHLETVDVQAMFVRPGLHARRDMERQNCPNRSLEISGYGTANGAQARYRW
jgi:hypothetical protein